MKILFCRLMFLIVVSVVFSCVAQAKQEDCPESKVLEAFAYKASKTCYPVGFKLDNKTGKKSFCAVCWTIKGEISQTCLDDYQKVCSPDFKEIDNLDGYLKIITR